MQKDKPIFTISIAADLLKLHPRTLMLYEKAGFITPHRTDTNRRQYSINDLEHLQFLKHLTQTQGINLKGVAKLLEAIEIGDKQGLTLIKRLFPAFKVKKLV